MDKKYTLYLDKEVVPFLMNTYFLVEIGADGNLSYTITSVCLNVTMLITKNLNNEAVIV